METQVIFPFLGRYIFLKTFIISLNSPNRGVCNKRLTMGEFTDCSTCTVRYYCNWHIERQWYTIISFKGSLRKPHIVKKQSK